MRDSSRKWCNSPAGQLRPIRAGAIVQGTVVPTAPKSGWSLTLNGGTRSIAEVYAAQKKAAKKYAGDDVSIGGYSSSGWTTNKVK